MLGEPERQKPKLLARLAATIVVLFLAWYIVSSVLSFFDSSIGRKTATILTVRSGDSVQVSLQGGEWQRGESSLKLYAGDSVVVRGNSDALLSFFDGTKVRLEPGSEVSVVESNRLPESTSNIGLTLKSGRVWASTASLASFTGSITRKIATENFVVSMPAESQVLISSSLVNVVRASNLGAHLDFTIPKVSVPDIYIGEGQFFSFTDATKTALEHGKDPYMFRDPVTQQLLKDEFLISSYALFTTLSNDIKTEAELSSSRATSPVANDDVVLVSPQNNAKISTKTVKVNGSVSERVASLRVNGQNIVINPDRTFSVEVNVSKERKVTVKVEAEDQQGILLASLERVVENVSETNVEPVRIKSPVASGGTLKTSQQEIEITGEAPVGTKTIVVNDYTLQLFKPGSKTWSYLASTKLGNLQKGTNIFTIYATDADDNRSVARSIIIEYTEVEEGNSSLTGSEQSSSSLSLKQNAPIAPGTISVTGPEPGTTAETSKSEIVLEGTTSPETNSISINGYSLSLYVAGKTTWNYIASTELQTMKRGKNVYRIVSRNEKGEVLDVLEYTISYNP